MNTIVEVQGLTKSYGDVMAVNAVSFSLTEGKIYGLLGRNGAGKTTIMQMLTAQIFPTSGTITIFGEAPYENSHVLNQLCFVKESQKYPTTFRVIDVLEMSALFFPRWDKEYAFSLVEDFRLPLKRVMSKLSRGMQSAVGIIVGLASRAPLTVFDEPYLGLDAVARSVFYDRLIEDYTEHPRTVVLSTHLIDEVSRLLEHVILIEDGKILLDEEADALRGRANTVIGPASKVEAFTVQKDVIQREILGSLISATVMGEMGIQDRKWVEELGLEIAPVSLQQLIVHLTNGASERKAAHVR